MSTKVRLYGPDRFCPDCGRWLVRVHEDGSFDLAAKANIAGSETVTVEAQNLENLFESDELWMAVSEATCLLCHPNNDDEPEEEQFLEPEKEKNRWSLLRPWNRAQIVGWLTRRLLGQK